ncbi:Glycosylphosphatidylinositol-mannosyltransferase I PIG-X/PBN1 protein [Dioscorea alata]|uniref:Glycosylphosphatidylinositol-mannosyltransferase I PIG-X/PBN1 protein n=1 Tax=Dioscorea alata TaxID=55571 RepID=A0ACB7WKR1_DIOAL|nr:Glycosylphosphatidylinositol-mannosyltransferase I PIG-X/PBN1 protein [Dioscorea alata]
MLLNAANFWSSILFWRSKVILFLLWGIVFCKVDSFGLKNDVKRSHSNIVIELPCSQKYLTGYFYEKRGQILESDFHGLAEEVGSDELSESLVHSLKDVFGFSELNRHLIGEGSHRHLVTNFKLNIKPDDMSWLNNHYCDVVVIERLPIGVFADPFELQHLVEHQVFLDVAVFGDTNLELPSALSNKSVVEVHMNTTHNVLSRQSEITMELPLHARYPPLDVAGYSKIEFGQPDLLMRCKPQVTQLDFCSWILTSWNDDTHKNGIFWLVPCGNKEHTTLVSSITFISALVSALLIVLSVICRSTNEDTKNS